MLLMPTLFLVRHASPDWTRKDIPYHIPPGPPLSAQGLAEAQQAAEFLRPYGVKQVYTSPLERCHHTAQIAAALAGVAPEVLDGLREWQPHESHEAVIARIGPVVDRFRYALHHGVAGPIALFTHGGPIRAALQHLGIDDATMETLRIYDHLNPVPPAGIWQIQTDSPAASPELKLVFIPPTAELFDGVWKV